MELLSSPQHLRPSAKLSSSKKSNRPRASNLGMPIYHRRRRDWRDDRSLILEVLEALQANDKLYDISSPGVENFVTKVDEIKKIGFETNADALLLGIYLRESLLKLSKKMGNYDLRVHALILPDDLSGALLQTEKKLTKSGLRPMPSVSLETLFPDPKMRGFALERMHILHRGDLITYLNSLVSKERDSLLGYSATIKDLIHICEHKIKQRRLVTQNRFTADEVDIWVPSLCLGIEVRDCWESKQEEDLLFLLKTMIARRKARFLAIICPDDLSDLTFHALREIERKEKIDGLSIIRVGDFGKYLDQVIQLSKD
jgi:hypothetical protein